MFRIIAIETLDREKYVKAHPHPNDNETLYKQIMKVLKPKQVYCFCNDFIVKNGFVEKKKDVISNHFYTSALDCHNAATMPNYYVSAIVGENGQGKSSLIELMMRLINNVSYALKQGLNKEYAANLDYLEEVYARLYFEGEDEHYYMIEQQNENLRFVDLDNPNDNVWNFCKSTENLLTNKNGFSKSVKSSLETLFYTIIINYSSYALRPIDFPSSEWQPVMKKSQNDQIIDTDEDGEPIFRHWLDTLFNKNDGYQTPIVLNPYRKNGMINFNKEKELLKDRIYYLVLNDTPVSNILNGKSVYSFTFDIPSSILYNPIYMGKKPLDDYKFNSKLVTDQMLECDLISGQADLEYVYEIGQQIINAWQEVLGFCFDKNGKEFWEDMDMARILNYIVYKTIKIAYQYSDYYQYRYSRIACIEYISKLYLNNDHITNKLHRCLSYIIFRFYGTGQIKNAYKENKVLTTKQYYGQIKKCLKIQKQILKRKRIQFPLKNANVNNHINDKVWTEDELFPAPVFETKLTLRNESTHEYIKYETLSSGEQHLIYSVSTALYHIQNICSKWNTNSQNIVKYRNICLVFDEAEIYSHPKMQMLFISYLLNSLDGLIYSTTKGRSHIDSIHIIIATHSPFMVTDVPVNNMLCLKDGKQVKQSETVGKSFGANIYDIMQQKFFVESNIGVLANRKISQIINLYNQKDCNGNPIDEHKREALFRLYFSQWEETAKAIGDPYISNVLESMLQEMKCEYQNQ